MYRGIKEVKQVLPDDFLEGEFAGGVELGFTSTTKSPEVALQYSGHGKGSIFVLDFSISTRGAAVGFLSQYPHEEELLFPPCTALQCHGVSEHRRTPYGEKRLVMVTAQVSNKCEDTRKIDQPETRPPTASGWGNLRGMFLITGRRRVPSVETEMVELATSPDGTASGSDATRSRKASAQSGLHPEVNDTTVRPRRSSARHESYMAADGMRPRARILSHADRGAEPLDTEPQGMAH